MSERKFDCEILLVGGGLANCLIAYALKQIRPDLSIIVLEKRDSLGAQHTWCFHEKDISKEGMALLTPFISHSWPGYSVYFPKYHRELRSAYYSIRSERLHEVLSPVLPVEYGVNVKTVGPLNVYAEDGRQWAANCVIDGRGFDEIDPSTVGYRKFVGLDLELEEPHGLKAPIFMDATGEQKEGFRFFNCLPFDERRVLVGDTRYSHSAHFDREDFKGEIANYAKARSWVVRRVSREEQGVFPIPFRASYLKDGRAVPKYWIERLVPCSGVRGGFFHPSTSHSLPYAVRLALKLSKIPDLKYDTIYSTFVTEANALRPRHFFFRYLNRVLFFGTEAGKAYRIWERFYSFPKGLIGRFYSSRLWPTDYLRIILGIPPVPLREAFRCLVHRREVSGE